MAAVSSSWAKAGRTQGEEKAEWEPCSWVPVPPYMGRISNSSGPCSTRSCGTEHRASALPLFQVLHSSGEPQMGSGGSKGHPSQHQGKVEKKKSETAIWIIQAPKTYLEK